MYVYIFSYCIYVGKILFHVLHKIKIIIDRSFIKIEYIRNLHFIVLNISVVAKGNEGLNPSLASAEN